MKSKVSLDFMLNHAGRRIGHLLNLYFHKYEVPIEHQVVSQIAEHLSEEQLELLWGCLHQITEQANQIIAEVEEYR